MTEKQFLMHQIAEAMHFYAEDHNSFHLDVIRFSQQKLERINS